MLKILCLIAVLILINVDSLEICLNYNNSNFNHQHSLQTERTGQRNHKSCSYAVNIFTDYESLANTCHFQPSVWKRCLCKHCIAPLLLILGSNKPIIKVGKINLTKEIAIDINLEFLVLKFQIAWGKIWADVFDKNNYRVSYIPHNTWFQRKTYVKQLN